MITTDISDVIVKSLEEFRDKRGWLTEIYRLDVNHYQPCMGYVSYTRCADVRGPHEHIKQSDFFIFVGPGNFALYLWDNRPTSPSYKKFTKLIVGNTNKVSVLVPPGVVHGYKSISRKGSISINLPDRLYRGIDKKEDVDEIRHENDENSEFKIEI